jgi:hypothetical protein
VYVPLSKNHCVLEVILIDRFRKEDASSKSQRRRENDVYTSRSLPSFNLGRLVCLFRSKFLFSCYLLIPVLFSISCQVMCKKRSYNNGQVFPDELVLTFNKFFLEKNVYFGILKSELCCIIWNKYNSCRYCLRAKCFSL